MKVRIHPVLALTCSLLAAAVLAGCSSNDATQLISASDAMALIQSHHGNESFVILDVRTPTEFADGHISGALNIDFYSSDFSADIGALAKNNVYLLHCASGGRSGKAADIMAGMGFAEVYDLDGGYRAFSALDDAAALLAAATAN